MIARRLALLSVAAFATMAALRICDPMLPLLAREFDASTGDAGSTVSAFALAYGLALMLFGPLGDRYGKFKVISIATLSCTAASLACAAATSLQGLVAFRAVAGIAAAGVTPLAMAWIGDNVPYERRQAVLAQLIGATTLGLIAGQSVGGLLAESLGWRSGFIVLGLVFFAAGILMCLEVRSPSSEGPPASAAHSAGFAAMLAAVVRERWARRILGFAFLEGVFVFGGLAFLPSHLHQRFGLPMSWAGGVLVLYGLGGLLYSRFARTLLGRLGETGLARLGGSLLAVYFAVLATLPSWGWALPACLAGGFGFYMLHNTMQTHATQMAPAARGTAVTLFSATLFLGHSLGVVIAGAVIDATSAIPVFAVSAVALLLLAWWFAMQASARRKEVLVLE
jgi:MFS transporter, YNFM family, putative membrane transport protein